MLDPLLECAIGSAPRRSLSSFAALKTGITGAVEEAIVLRRTLAQGKVGCGLLGVEGRGRGKRSGERKAGRSVAVTMPANARTLDAERNKGQSESEREEGGGNADR
jgi:hypothetical protein